ncbi:MAG: group 1 truncated hemoglobin [Planctomycetales bacterium]|nr:group 1 truncated hemoglobin [Planctomycetales bacterium]
MRTLVRSSIAILSASLLASCGGGGEKKSGNAPPAARGGGSSAASQPAPAPAAPKKPLYERLGGATPIACVCDDFIERVLVNETLNANPRIAEARDRVPKAGLKFQVTALVCQVTGGPEMYTGRSMKDSHAHLGITEREWDALVADFKACLDHFKVPAEEQKELFEIVGSTKKDIVMAPGATPAEVPAGGPESFAAPPNGMKPSLYARLGGVYPIACVVDEFIEVLLVDDILNANPKIKAARDRVPKQGLKFLVTSLVCQVTGGPQKYAGRSMKDSHKDLAIAEEHWNAMAADFKKVLDKFQVPEPEQNELFEIVGSTKADIVTAE